MAADASLGACHWSFPDPSYSDEEGLVAVGADLEPATLLAAYRCGLFPMPARPFADGLSVLRALLGDGDPSVVPVVPGGRRPPVLGARLQPASGRREPAASDAPIQLASDGRIGWWSPPERGVLEPDRLIVHRSLRQACRRFEVRVDTAFAEVIDGCADPGRPHGWIDDQMRAAYVRLHRAGFAHSVETWRDGELVGGLYGVAVGGLFAGESMFHRARDASKVALVALAAGLRDGHPRLIDVQWATPHLRSLGASAIPRRQYLERLPELLASPPAAMFAPDRSPQAQPPGQAQPPNRPGVTSRPGRPGQAQPP